MQIHSSTLFDVVAKEQVAEVLVRLFIIVSSLFHSIFAFILHNFSFSFFFARFCCRFIASECVVWYANSLSSVCCVFLLSIQPWLSSSVTFALLADQPFAADPPIFIQYASEMNHYQIRLMLLHICVENRR